MHLSIRLLALSLLCPGLAAQEVPLTEYTDFRFPNGMNVGVGYGVSFGDYDADGWIDMVVLDSGRLWRNQEGVTWARVLDLNDLLPDAQRRYGVSFGDYNNDGLPDIATEPRQFGGDECFHLLKNLGGGPNFVDVATDPSIVIGQPCSAQAETYCWGDVDDDGDLDLFLPIYEIGGSPGNKFLENLGPTGPGGAYRLRDATASANLGNPPVNNRAEGAQFADVDFDGDLDLYSNGTLYQNRTISSPRFVQLNEPSNGIALRSALDEGASFFDYDLDGDYDLVVSYVRQGLRIWENRGDAVFFSAVGKIEDITASALGLSNADWDNDGDQDFTSQFLFHRNQKMETGLRQFTTASFDFPTSWVSSATPSWGDWDKDGDLDCALGNFGTQTHFMDNTLYDESTPMEDRRYVRVRVMRDNPTPLRGPLAARGLETEYGANVTVVPKGANRNDRLRQFTASGHGYLNQNEYVLHFGMPARTEENLSFDVEVDFPGLSSKGILRIDSDVNPALGGIELESLSDREITVFRSGKVVLDGVAYPPATNGFSQRLTTTTGGLAQTSIAAPLQRPALTDANHFVGLEIIPDPEGGPLLVDELIVDGQLAPALDCGGAGRFNVALWDVSAAPLLVSRAAFRTAVRNDRSYFPLRALLQPGHRYRVVAAVTALRATDIAGPVLHGGTLVNGGLSYQDADACSGIGAASALVDASRTYLALRYRERTPIPQLSVPVALTSALGAIVRGE